MQVIKIQIIAAVLLCLLARHGAADDACLSQCQEECKNKPCESDSQTCEASKSDCLEHCDRSCACKGTCGKTCSLFIPKNWCFSIALCERIIDGFQSSCQQVCSIQCPRRLVTTKSKPTLHRPALTHSQPKPPLTHSQPKPPPPTITTPDTPSEDTTTPPPPPLTTMITTTTTPSEDTTTPPPPPLTTMITTTTTTEILTTKMTTEQPKAPAAAPNGTRRRRRNGQAGGRRRRNGEGGRRRRNGWGGRRRRRNGASGEGQRRRKRGGRRRRA